MINPKISIIMPVYNAGHRLQNCIESILSQKIKDIEIICVLDCPTDGSDKVVEYYAQQDSRIRVVKNAKNLNIGESRNVGIRMAKGVFLAFCDHDDIVLPNMYQDMYDLGIQENADIILGVPEYTYTQSSKNHSYYYPKEGDIREEILKCVIGRGKGDTDDWAFFFSHGVIWDKLYRRSLIIDNNIRFVDNNHITFEDNLFVIETFFVANKAIVYNKKVYQHTIESTNTASSFGYTKKERVVAYVEYLYSILLKQHASCDKIQRFANSASRYYIGCITRPLLAKKDFSVVINVLKFLQNQPLKKLIFAESDFVTLLKESKTLSKKIAYTLFYFYLKFF